METFELTQEFKNRIQSAIEQQDGAYIVQSFADINPADIAVMLHEFNEQEVHYLFGLFLSDVQAAILPAMDEDIQRKIFETASIAQLSNWMNCMDSDDAADILNAMPIQLREEVLLAMDDDYRKQVEELLRYPADVAGGLMAKELIKVDGEWTVVQCAKEIRKQAINVTKFYAVYVVDAQDKLLGQISLHQLILADLRTHVKELVDDEVISVPTYMEDKEVANIMKKYDLESVPVVNHGKLVGRITIDDVVDVISEQADEERQMMSGISEDVEEDDSVWRNTRARLPWLLVGILGGILNARFMGLFENQLARLTAIAFFIPLIQATGGNVGIQSSSIVVQSLASYGLIDLQLWKRLGKVLTIALVNGLLLALIVLFINILFFHDTRLSVIVSLSLFSVVIFSSFVGTAIPLLLNRIGINPALASGPFITTTNDLLGLTVYFVTIRLFL